MVFNARSASQRRWFLSFCRHCSNLCVNVRLLVLGSGQLCPAKCGYSLRCLAEAEKSFRVFEACSRDCLSPGFFVRSVEPLDVVTQSHIDI
jgi:hypothetical protein